MKLIPGEWPSRGRFVPHSPLKQSASSNQSLWFIATLQPNTHTLDMNSIAPLLSSGFPYTYFIVKRPFKHCTWYQNGGGGIATLTVAPNASTDGCEIFFLNIAFDSREQVACDGSIYPVLVCVVLHQALIMYSLWILSAFGLLKTFFFVNCICVWILVLSDWGFSDVAAGVGFIVNASWRRGWLVEWSFSGDWWCCCIVDLDLRKRIHISNCVKLF